MPQIKNLTTLFVFALCALLSCSSDTTPPQPEIDSDGDGIFDSQETANGTGKNDACDPIQSSGYTAYDTSNGIWSGADCDSDGIANGVELTNGTDPYVDDLDTDGDGLLDSMETLDGTDKNDACDPAQNADYDGYDSNNSNWADADCDGDGIDNGAELSNSTDPYYDDRVFAVAEFLPNLSQLLVFEGPVADLKFSLTADEYGLITPLFTDYSYKLRSISLPQGGQMTYNDEGLLQFPDSTVITKTFYYLNDERDASLGRKIIETRVLIKKNGSWQMGNYLWNDQQTEANLDETNDVHVVLVDYIDKVGEAESIAYEIPNTTACIQCHNNDGTSFPIGPKARNMNFVHNGNDQIQFFVDKGLLSGAPASSQIAVLPQWDDETISLEDRARAYMDVNCAHCHQPGGFNGNPVAETIDLRFETPFANTNITAKKADVIQRINSTFPNFSMPFNGTTIPHVEGIELMEDYINSLD
ncbi:MAG: hypothetical protein ACR2MT_16390 [Aurantibacter sp.]